MAAFGIDIDRDRIRVFKERSRSTTRWTVSWMRSTRPSHIGPRGVPQGRLRPRIRHEYGHRPGVAIPHVRIEGVLKPAISLGISRKGLDFDTDNQLVHAIVLFAMPAGSQKEYLGLLAQVMTALKQPGFLERLVNCDTPEEVEDMLAEAS